MKQCLKGLVLVWTLATIGLAQAEVAPPATTAAGREALTRCRELASRVKGLRGNERLAALAEAASNYDRVAEGFAGEPRVAAQASYAAAELWRRHGSLPFAERDYARAAEVDRPRFGPRGLLGSADMQRRQQRFEDALGTYDKVVEAAANSPQAQLARLAKAKLLQRMDRLPAAVAAAQVALECARPGRQVLDACNVLALVQIQAGDLDAAERALEYARESVDDLADAEPERLERQRRAVEAMSGWRALRRARDRQTDAAADAARLEADRKGG
ncbi:MAG: hypothetical protein KDE27_02340 [Planctomycetes bacterium]|nr:hypothetical protein [Planctomycetota bacterium]